MINPLLLFLSPDVPAEFSLEEFINQSTTWARHLFSPKSSKTCSN
jgi:hypothetical protein